MNDNELKTYRPSKKGFKKGLVKVVLFILGHSFKTLKLDKGFMKEISDWGDKTIMLSVLEKGPSVSIKKEGNDFRFIGARIENPDLAIYFKNIDSAFPAFLGRMSVVQAFSQHKVMVKGFVGDAISFIRVVEIAEAALFPGFLQNKIFIKKPKFSWRRLGIRTLLYLKAVPLFIMSLFFKSK